jgi:hypothetical protein
MKHRQHRSWFVVPLLMLGFVGGCFLEQKLDETAASGANRNAVSNSTVASTGAGGATGSGTGRSTGSITSSTTGGGGSSVGSGGSAPSSDGGTLPLSCTMTRSKARQVLRADCAGCHEKPNNQANFDFILDLDTLKAGIASTGQKFVMGGDPLHSRIYVRMSAGEMPPVGKTPRPSAEDVKIVWDWLQNCFDDDDGWEAPDGGDGLDNDDKPMEAGPPPGCGGPGQVCCTGNVCDNGGCCVFGQCHANGQTCTAPTGSIGLYGTCQNGTCNDSMGAACGAVGQNCCDNSSCTASRAACLVGTTTCSACGGNAQPCCKAGSAQTCIEGNACIGAGVGRTGNCQTCGAMGQPCCGAGVAAQKTCQGSLQCAAVAGVGDRCGP